MPIEPVRKESAIAGKEPWLAVVLSRLVPGTGQIYAGKARRGAFIIGAETLLLILGSWLLLSPTGDIRISLVLLSVAGLIPIWSLFDAHTCAKRANSIEFEQSRKQTKDPWLAVFLSQILPGLGHAYLHKWGWAILWLIGLIAVAVIQAMLDLAIQSNLQGVVYFLASIVSVSTISAFVVFVAYRAYQAAPIKRESSNQLILIISLAFFLITSISAGCSWALKAFFLETRYIPSGSMLPTLQINDRLFIDKWSYRFQQPQRGDVAVFNPTEALQAKGFQDAFIARIIGLPGEKIEVKNGKVYVNNQPLVEPYIAEPPQYQWGPVPVPQDAYIVLGDNRNNSYDSHYWGFVPREYLIGKVSKRFWPLDRTGPVK